MGVAVAVLLIMHMGVWVWQLPASSDPQPLPLAPYAPDATALQPQETLPAEQEEIWVDLKGAVNRPGVYKVAAGTRVFEVLELAGGTSEDADTQALNLAAVLQDGMVLRVPRAGEVPPGELVALPGTNDGRVNLNRATAEELDSKLPGIGPAKARAIVADREENGPFKSVDELVRVNGIGEKTLENIRDLVTVGP